ncbi:MAG: hypothetical protein BGP25_13310 [Lysobacterales bacterium 63-13]|mgnify:CR=1 FL=1|nr:MAG: hypothetical protein BGP25_13310 [Xanthomonadales bacterium 63-13]
MASDDRSSPDELRSALFERFGPMMSGPALRQALGYRTASAFRQAMASPVACLPAFRIPGRRGWYALTQEVAAWLINRAEAARRDEST